MDSVRSPSGRINTMENMIEQIRENLTKAGKRLQKRGLVVGTAGNISARIPKTDEFLIKPSGVSLEFLKPEELVVVNLQGNKVRGEMPVSMETPIHAAIYRTRKDAQAVVHTHAPAATAFGIAEREILPLQVEMYRRLPEGVPVIPFERPGSKMLAKKIQEKIAKYDAVILGNHGIVTIGSTIQAACDLNEMIEEAAKIQLLVNSLGGAGEGEMDLASLKKRFMILEKPENNTEDV
jgi:L-fuculose-phosphate aldolase